MDKFLIKLYTKNPSPEILIEIMQTMQSYQDAGKFSAIDEILGVVNCNRLCDVIIISLLRCNYANRSKFTNWDRLLTKAKKRYAGTDKESILKVLELQEQ